MNLLVVFAHPKPRGSFNHAVLEQFTLGLRDGGRGYEVVDLYRSSLADAYRRGKEF